MSTASRTPARIAELAHVALHANWALPSSKKPTGTGCADCVPDVRDLLDPLWPLLGTGRPAPRWAHQQAARALHNAWSSSRIPVGETHECRDCLDDIQTVLDAVEAAVAPRKAKRSRLRRHDTTR